MMVTSEILLFIDRHRTGDAGYYWESSSRAVAAFSGMYAVASTSSSESESAAIPKPEPTVLAGGSAKNVARMRL